MGMGVTLGLGLDRAQVTTPAPPPSPPPAYTPALQFNDARNSQYLALLAA